MPLQTGSSPAQRMLRNRTDDDVSQKETSRAHDTDGCVWLLAHRLVLVLVNRLNNGNSRLILPPNVWTSSRSRFVLLKMLKNSLAKRSDCWQKGMFTMFCTFYKALFCNSVRFIPRVSHYSGKEDPSTENELRALARRIVRTEYMTMVGAWQRDWTTRPCHRRWVKCSCSQNRSFVTFPPHEIKLYVQMFMYYKRL